MEYNISKALGTISRSLLCNAAAMLAGAVVVHFFTSKQTKIVLDNGISAELVTIGGKDNPKAVYISNQKHRVEVLPAIFTAATAVGVSYLKKKYDEDNGIINIDGIN